MKNKIEIGDLVRFQDGYKLNVTGTGVVLGVGVSTHHGLMPAAAGKERVALIVDPDGRIYYRAFVRCQLLAKGKQ